MTIDDKIKDELTQKLPKYWHYFLKTKEEKQMKSLEEHGK